jgi:hypothetical protein
VSDSRRELLQRRRQLRGRRHDRVLDQDGDHDDVRARQRGLDLEPDEVAGILQPRGAVGTGDRRPARADHREEHVARAGRPRDLVDEVDPRAHLHVPEDRVLPEAVREVVVEPSRRAGGVLAAVVHEEACVGHAGALPGVAGGRVRDGAGCVHVP